MGKRTYTTDKTQNADLDTKHLDCKFSRAAVHHKMGAVVSSQIDQETRNKFNLTICATLDLTQQAITNQINITSNIS